VTKLGEGRLVATNNSVLCSEHLEKDAYYMDPELLRHIRIKKLKHAIPTVFSYRR